MEAEEVDARSVSVEKGGKNLLPCGFRLVYTCAKSVLNSGEAGL